MNIYVGNMNFNLSNEDLFNLFAQFGQVTSAKIINDRETGRSKGFGFVEMSSDQEAMTAIEKMNGQMFDGRALNVSEARPQAPREGGGRSGGGFGGGRGGRY